MEKIIGKEMPIEKQRDILLMQTALKLPLLYQTLVEVYGQEKGRAIYEEIFEAPDFGQAFTTLRIFKLK